MTHSLVQKLVFASIFAGAVLAVVPSDRSGLAGSETAYADFGSTVAAATAASDASHDGAVNSASQVLSRRSHTGLVR